MTDQSLDPVAVMDRHTPLHRCIGGDFVSSRDPHCEPYLLAEGWQETLDSYRAEIGRLTAERNALQARISPDVSNPYRAGEPR